MTALPDGYNPNMMYVITVTPPTGSPRRFLGENFRRAWDNSPGPCLYVGNSQGGRSGGLPDPNDSIIEPTYRSYRVNGLYNTSFTFNRFRDAMCPTDTLTIA